MDRPNATESTATWQHSNSDTCNGAGYLQLCCAMHVQQLKLTPLSGVVASVDSKSPCSCQRRAAAQSCEAAVLLWHLWELLHSVAGMFAWDLVRTGVTDAGITLLMLTAGQGVQTAPGEPPSAKGSQGLCQRAAGHNQETKCLVRFSDHPRGGGFSLFRAAATSLAIPVRVLDQYALLRSSCCCASHSVRYPS